MEAQGFIITKNGNYFGLNGWSSCDPWIFFEKAEALRQSCRQGIGMEGAQVLPVKLSSCYSPEELHASEEFHRVLHRENF